MIALLCDRCGEVFDYRKNEDHREGDFWPGAMVLKIKGRISVWGDLCPSCAVQIERFILTAPAK